MRMDFFKKNLSLTLLGLGILVYSVYFSTATILRMHAFAAHYYDLGIMHQTTFNTFKAIQTGDFSRFLEMTNTLGPEQIKRMAIHNDFILALIAPLYFIYPGPETLLVVQSVALALGALGLFLLTREVLGKKERIHDWVALGISLSYLLYPIMNYSNLFDFHGVTLATPFLIFMFYFWYTKRFKWAFLFAVLSMLTKEQVALTVLFFSFFAACTVLVRHHIKKEPLPTVMRRFIFPSILALTCIVWFIFSIKVLIPASRGGTEHFALEYYGEFGDSPGAVIANILKNPLKLVQYVMSGSSVDYLRKLFQPLAFLPLLSPLVLAIAAPEFGINILSESDNMRTVIFHYTAVLTPFLFIAAIFSVALLRDALQPRLSHRLVFSIIVVPFAVAMLYSVFNDGPLPFSKNRQTYMFNSDPPSRQAVYEWAEALKDDSIRVSSTGKLAPFFTSRRYFYDLSPYYTYADYVVVNPDEAINGWGKERSAPGYEALTLDPKFEKVYDEEYLEVYKRK